MTHTSFGSEKHWDHEELVVRRGRRSGLTTMVAAHSRVLGPAIGGCRLATYPDLDAAVRDVLRLSRAMTDKCAVAGVPFGGGKSVIAVPAGSALTADRRHAALLDHADLIAELDGSYVAGPDIGTGPEDMLVFRSVSPHAFCVPEAHGGSGSSSGPTAVGVLAALRAAARAVLGTADLAGHRVVISGFGAVGTHLAANLAGAGAEVVVSDVDPERRRVARELGLRWAEPEEALTLGAHVVIPAAVGGVLDRETVAGLDTPLVVGPANNQLADDSVAADLAARGIAWVPDFVASAGGIIYTLAREVDGVPYGAALSRVEAIEETVTNLLAAAETAGTTMLHEARTLARQRLSSGNTTTSACNTVN
ncbi:Glu/Leu/Phe/Val dehydrogenase dimerization domain-containing protein [Actinokineospora sp. NBRC 105648]|uniref:Glu/Leu/Phe/Val dehydrogenase dimerization domain-containing protein n=1 Tax=Actinokineospora sp. NBRC 105648 TaxID=3032206 RepID=UPI0024A1541E|nr:Glu/Leu/Phe/Val dehydrogenase dimerization domain-containing protein [Actinokineospora sp. NBRC 105648]GLZ41590.1 leucine dehydrogenase [Actinokineospora sp. NBRC 105648]